MNITKAACRVVSTIAAAFTIAVLPATTLAQQAGNGDPGVIQACVGKGSQIVRIIGPGGSCGPSETAVQWNVRGPQGAPGADGTNGTNGADGTSVVFAGYFTGSQHGCPNGGATYAVGTLQTHVCNGADANDGILFSQHDTVQTFDLITGTGRQIGTARGLISGTTSVAFQFAPAAPPADDVLPITFSNKVILTDLDGDQIYFDNDGTGAFHLGLPGFPFKGLGGPLVGSYVVTGGTGKYQTWAVGTTYTYRAISTSPPEAGGLGSVYAEIR